jgi:hypothetical protein
MKRSFVLLFVLLFVALSFASAQTCNTIKSGAITDAKGSPITMGFDKYGYNYQAHMFNGLTANYSRPDVVATEGNENLVMKWSDDWVANVDCNGDGKLDRGYNAKTGAIAGFSKGWVTNHFEGDYEEAGVSYHYTYFAKIVYDGGEACGAGSDSCLWGVYTIIEEVNNDPHAGFHGNVKSKLMNPAGLGVNTN